MITSCKLPLQFEPQRLRADYERLCHRFHTHPSLNAEGWEGAPLISVQGETGPKGLFMGEQYEKTPLLDDCPYIAEVIKALHCESSARVPIMRLKPGEVIPRIPIATPPIT